MKFHEVVQVMVKIFAIAEWTPVCTSNEMQAVVNAVFAHRRMR